MKKELTSRENKVLEWIKEYQLEHGGYPTYREIQGALKFNSINSVSQYIKQLAKKGYVELIKNKGYRLAAQERSQSVTIPLLGSVQAGGPNASQEVQEHMSFPQEMVPSPHRAFLLRVRGNSMSDAGIHEDDLVIVDSSKEAQLGDIVVALIDGESTVKRLMEKKGKRYLQAESSEHEDIYPEGEWEIQGIVSGLWRAY